MTDPLTWTLTEAARAIREKAISARELTESCLAQIATHDGDIKAFLRVDNERALANADWADDAVAAGKALGPLHGVPLAHKDQFERAGWVSTCASKTREGIVSERTATLLARLDAAGALDLGTLNMSEFAFHVWGFNPFLGPPRNPWASSRIAGASSGGSAAALAARMVFGALGSDSGGSVRHPAALSGVVGLLPTHGRLSRHGMLGSSTTLDAPGPMARTVADVACLLGVLAGHDPSDQLSSEHPAPDYPARLDVPLAGRTIGVAGDALITDLPGDLQDAYNASVSVFKALGAKTVVLELDKLEPLSAVAAMVFASEAGANHAPALRERGDDIEPQIRERLLQGFAYPAAASIAAVNDRASHTRAFVETAFTEVELLVLPAATDVAPRAEDVLGSISPLTTKLDPGYFMRAFNYLGLPVLAVPCGFSRIGSSADSPQGLPVAFQLVGRPFAEAALLNAGHLFQRETGIHHIVPAMSMRGDAAAPVTGGDEPNLFSNPSGR